MQHIFCVASRELRLPEPYFKRRCHRKAPETRSLKVGLKVKFEGEISFEVSTGQVVDMMQKFSTAKHRRCFKRPQWWKVGSRFFKFKFKFKVKCMPPGYQSGIVISYHLHALVSVTPIEEPSRASDTAVC